MLNKYDVVTIGGATEDLFFTVDDYSVINNQVDPLNSKLIAFDYGSKVGIKDTFSGFGGGAANVAVALARIGHRVAIVTCVGDDDTGQRLVGNLLKHRINCRFIHHAAGKSARSLILKTIANDHVIFTYRGVNDKLQINHNLAKKLTKAKRIYLSSLTGNWKALLTVVFNSGVKLAWNPGRMQLAAGYSVLKPFLARTDVLILNKAEATELVLSSMKDKTSLNISIILRKLYKFGPRLVVITEGAKGAIAFDGKKIYRQVAIKSKVADTTGVGDAFMATFVATLDSGHDISKALKIAAKNSASVVAHHGAQHGLLSKSQLGL